MKSIIALMISASLVACGGNSAADNHTTVAAQVQDCTAYHLRSNSGTHDVEGCGAVQDREYDAVAWFVTNEVKPGTQDYRDLVSKGLTIILTNPNTVSAFVAQSRNSGDLVIEKM